jgi:hypothetical protein
VPCSVMPPTIPAIVQAIRAIVWKRDLSPVEVEALRDLARYAANKLEDLSNVK